MRTTGPLGTFDLTSPAIVVMDPGYNIEDVEMPYGGCLVRKCRPGSWSVSVLWDKPVTGDWWPAGHVLPRSIIAVEESNEQAILAAPEWLGVCTDIGQDGGVFALVDLAHFGDRGVIPPAHPSLRPHPEFGVKYSWYNYLCDILGNSQAVMVPHGAMVSWDGGMDVETLSIQDEVVGVRVSISGWPYPYGTEG